MSENIMLTYEKGLANTPSDILSEDGMLSECVNLEVKNGELVPMDMPVKLGIKLDASEKLVLVHKTKSGLKTYVTLSDGILRFRNAENGTFYELTVDTGDISSIQYLGNTIIAYSKKEAYYILYKDGGYVFLGSKMPDIGLSFNLVGDMVVSDTVDIDVDGDSNGNPDFSTEEKRKDITDKIIPLVNKFIAEESEAKGKFIFPFLVRYAYQLYDGTYIMQSAPVLLMPSTTFAPLCGFLSHDYDKPPFKTFMAACPSDLYIFRDTDVDLDDWSDIISNVSIFVSSPIRTYDQNGTIDGYSEKTGDNIYAKSTFYGQLNGEPIRKYQISQYFGFSNNAYTVLDFWNLPSKSTKDIYAEISGCSLFYKYTSLTLDQIKSNRTIYSSQTGVNPVSGIEVMERLPDDYMTHDTLIPNVSLVYNGRLNISNIKRILFEGFSPISLAQPGLGDLTGRYEIYTYIKSNDKTVVVKSPHNERYFDMYGTYLFYPDTDAYRMVIVDIANTRYVEVPLTPHVGLNGAVYFNNFNDLVFKSGTIDVPGSEDAYEYLYNKLFLSEVNNPFYFSLNGIYTIGTGEIIGIAAVTRPISQGQFGEFPLMAFCSDGNFALRVSNEGYYETISPMQEDIVIGNDKITPLENSVAIVTKKGLMVSSGGDMVHHASLMSGKQLIKSSLPGLDTQSHSYLIGNTTDTDSFLEYLYGSRMAFDYASNRLFIYNPEKDFSYVYNFDSGTTSKVVMGSGLKIVTSVIDYPDTILEDNEGNLYSVYDKKDINTLTDHRLGFAITKSLKFGSPFKLKSVKQVRNISTLSSASSYVRYTLYGSNDNMTYYKLASRYGKPYKCYRIALYTNLLPKDAFIGTALTVEERRTNKLR